LQVTTDHTWIQEAIDFGALTPQQAVGHPNAHVIRRYLGAQSPMAPDFRLRLQPNETDVQSEANQGLRLLPGDRLVLCSDGLTDLVTKEEISSAIRSHERKAALDYLINLANSRGGHDNITIIYLEVPPDENLTVPIKSKAPLEKQRSYRWLRACLGISLLLALLAMLGILLWKYKDIVSHPRGTPTPSPAATRRSTPIPPVIVHTTLTATSTSTIASTSTATNTSTATSTPTTTRTNQSSTTGYFAPPYPPPGKTVTP
jgi:PPM family protein phosphatase